MHKDLHDVQNKRIFVGESLNKSNLEPTETMKTLPVSFNEAIEQSIKKYWNRNALSDYGEITFQYKDAARIIAKLHIFHIVFG